MSKKAPITLWAESDDALLPPLGKPAHATPAAEVARLLRKVRDVELCMDATRDQWDRQKARLDVLEREIDALEAKVTTGPGNTTESVSNRFRSRQVHGTFYCTCGERMSEKKKTKSAK